MQWKICLSKRFVKDPDISKVPTQSSVLSFQYILHLSLEIKTSSESKGRGMQYFVSDLATFLIIISLILFSGLSGNESIPVSLVLKLSVLQLKRSTLRSQAQF